MIPAATAQYLIEYLSTAILWIDKDLQLQSMNPAAENLLELSAKQAYGLKIDELFPHSGLNNKVLRKMLKKRCSMIERGMPLHLHSARSILVDCCITPLQDEIYGNSLLVELTQVDQHLRITREENLLLQQQATRNMVRGLAHEIKNPLGGLRGAAQLLERELPNPDLREYTHIIIGEADRLQNLVNRILLPNTLLHKGMINIHQILMRVRQLILSEAGEGIKIITDFDPSIPELYADADQMIQAALNIIRNAVQAMQNYGTIEVRTRVQRQMNLGSKRHKLVIRIDVTDNGPGIPANMIDQVFYPLVTGRAEGTGLGLSIAQSLINQHGGLIECSSQPGETVFTIWLPVEHKDEKL
ncbi:MAG: hypothetical protein RIS84_1878 [Pseudomonadota bacterium]|jgi:two-component system nitrogen regulation sensor histidine kinase GlnL